MILVNGRSPRVAEQHERARAFAKAAGRQNRVLKEGFAVVDQRGNVTSLAQGPAQRVTGDQWERIQKRLGEIDRRELMSVAAAREVMKKANRAMDRIEAGRARSGPR